MKTILGIDTSNYTTSAAAYCRDDGQLFSFGKLLPVKDGALGLRQSDAVFEHVRQFPEVLREIPDEVFEGLAAVGVSVCPSEQEGSYMPCFLSGICAAESIAKTHGIPLYRFSHQAGHVMAALYSAKRTDLIQSQFLAFHVSGGTTDLLLVRPCADKPFAMERIGCSLDLKMGQAVDRLGVRLGLPFPAGKYLDDLALYGEKVFTVRPSLRGIDCSLSGLENHYDKWLRDGYRPEDVAYSFFCALAEVLDQMACRARDAYGTLPIVFSGGVTANSVIRKVLKERLSDISFAEPRFSSDNAAGIALLADYVMTGDL